MSLQIQSTILFCLMAFITQAQTVLVKGTLTDKENKEPLIGATILLEGTSTGTVTDYDGNYELKVPVGKSVLVVSYVGYESQTLNVDLAENAAAPVYNFELSAEAKTLEGVIVVGTVNKNSASALALLQQKSPGMLTGISATDIQRSPDRNTSDVLKRVSGTTVQDNKFVVVRGLSDRYNIATINGMLLPSTEPDRRAFSFDLFPSSVLSSLVIYKTASPDLPGEFAGGVVQVNTKEAPEEPFFNVSLGGSYNSVSTGKAYKFYQTGDADWTGKDDGTRALPEGITKAGLDNFDTRYEVSRKMPNDWAITPFNSMSPSYTAQMSGGFSKQVAGKPLGILAALNYNNTNRILDITRKDFLVSKEQLYTYSDFNYRKDYTLGGLVALAYQVGKNVKLSWNNIYTQMGSDQYIEREGSEVEQTRDIRALSMLYTGSNMFSSQLLGEAALNAQGMKLKWGLNYNEVNRSIPSYRRFQSTRDFGAEEGQPFFNYLPIGAPSPNYAGRFYSNQNETSYGGTVDLLMPYGENKKNQVKIGAMVDHKDRSFAARVFGYTIARINQFDQSLYTASIDKLFDAANIGDKGLVLKESTNPNDSYDATGDLLAGYAMAEHYFGKLRVSGGARVENFVQKLQSTTFSGEPIQINKPVTDLLPSLNLTYSLNEKNNIRLSASQTVSRPNFRELAPFSFFDFNLSASINGSPDLVRTKITNLDLKYEFFPAPNQNISVSGFYKRFQDPIEQFYETLGAGTRNFNFKNAPSAVNYGAELEYRFGLGIFTPVLNNFSFYGNLAYIRSEIDISNDPVSAVAGNTRPLQGQSPYIINGGLAYTNPVSNTNVTVLLNRIGRRIWLVGSNGYLDTYENPRTVLDFQISQRVFKKLEIKVNIQDALNNEAIFYQDQNNSKKFDDGDTQIIGFRPGANYSLTLSYQL